uniref:NADH-ubiquinone oxidoreductase chain 2 n=1 Tax=Acetes chinensis TaxID=439396 RepID=H9M5N6_9EUCA|nr:NADH dehydrogenase subunit 2 [Acetes chinensis]AEQ36603.1 NADH dehydrogenase subunit 2 [Acetes chinensis]
MFFSSTQILFMTTLILGTILTISSPSWFTAWVGLELNLLSFIPLISSKNSQFSSEAALKYFLVQAMGSAIIILTASLWTIKFNETSYLFLLALLLKSGSAPFHFWFPNVMEGLFWPQALILMTIQKIAPFSLMSYITPSTSYLMFLAIILSAIIGSLGGLNQTSLRKIMAYSSINHMAWMLSAITISNSAWITYFFIYSTISTLIVTTFFLYQSFYISQIIFAQTQSSLEKMISFLMLLSLGGLPPFAGFMAKWFILQEMVANNMIFVLLILLGSTLITLFFYIRITISAFVLSAPKMKWQLYSFKMTTIPSALLFINFMGLLTPSLIFMLM